MTQHVVIVDDDDLTLKLFGSIAGEIPGVVVHTFLTSTEAIDWYHGKEVDCFVFDYNMPLPNGMQMIALVRALPEFAHVPIVIVTGAHEREVRYQALDAGANDFLQKPVDYREMVARMTTLLALRAAQKRLAMQIGSLEQSLLDSEERSRQHAERLEVLWGIANNPNLRDDELIQAMLQRGAAAIRPGQNYRGVLARVEGDAIRIEAAAETGDSTVRVGALVPLADTIVGKTLQAGGGTYAFDDIKETDHPAPTERRLAWRSRIGTSFTAGGSTYTLVFSSREPTAKLFGSQDKAYVEVLAAFFSSHFQQKWQSSRLGHQLEHDSLTGLWNRSRFRSLGRAAFEPGAAAAVAVINLVQFHALNEKHGHLTGDAVLVEVAAALSAQAREGEIVARTGGNTFAVFFPSVPSRELLEDSVERFGVVFETAMGIGDREGKESLFVSGRIGIAHAPADGATLDDLLLLGEYRSRANLQPGHSNQFTYPGASRSVNAKVT
jgi:diguanylate cyclase (GGDEF)-like protein